MIGFLGQHGFDSVMGCTAEKLLCKRLAEAPTVRNTAEGFALLLPLVNPLDGVAKRNNRKNIDFGWDIQQSKDLGQALKANPVRPYSFGPGRQDHRLDRRIGIR
jgi:hypothetical protein